MTSHAEAFRTKMAKEGLSEAFIRAFLSCYNDLVEGKTGLIAEDTILPVDKLPDFDSLPASTSPELLGQTVVLKLNGGLGTSMGLEKAKSLLRVKGDDTFLDFIAKQVLALRKEHNFPLKFMLMNSFSTSADTNDFLKKYPEFSNVAELELLQNKAPKVRADNLEPVEWDKNKELEWCPPGHGDLYAALLGSGKLDELLGQGFKYMFVSNSDNLGATLDLKILAFFASSNAPMLAEVCERTESDKKGGHLARNKEDGKLLLRESAQCPKEDEGSFQDISRHRFFNTNNLWLNLPLLKEAMDKNGGVLSLPLIRNAKTVDPRDASSTKVYQLETAMGAAIASMPGSQALVVPRSRFAPVKTCTDLFVLRSDAYHVTEDYRLVLVDKLQGQAPFVDLDGKYYKLVDQLEEYIPNGVPSLVDLKRLKVTGRVLFHPRGKLSGTVSISNSADKPLSVEGDLHDASISV
eukprot:TRINITY_DN54276_c0_g1_i1.p1 TRINITY_DN54276_c0_g1~~TRINITY_DN54276_c0_g1_i1.p1  ORF type:complete len:478 (-),score=122.80 TRINITY_DN54276_c0_g1_i1:48-1439(-)